MKRTSPYSKRLSALQHIKQYNGDRDFTPAPFLAYEHEHLIASVAAIDADKVNDTHGFSTDQYASLVLPHRSSYAPDDCEAYLIYDSWILARATDDLARYVGDEVVYPLSGGYDQSRAHPVCQRKVRGWVCVMMGKGDTYKGDGYFPRSARFIAYGLLPTICVARAECHLLNLHLIEQGLDDAFFMCGFHGYYELTLRPQANGEPRRIYLYEDNYDTIKEAINDSGVDAAEVENFDQGLGVMVKTYGVISACSDVDGALQLVIDCALATTPC